MLESFKRSTFFPRTRQSRYRVAIAISLIAAPFCHAAGPLVITTSSLPNGTAGSSYQQAIGVTGGTCSATGTATVAIDAGALPPGISVISTPGFQNWTLQGIPTAAGAFSFTLHLFWTHQRISPFDQMCVDEAVKPFSIRIDPPTQFLTVDRPQINTTFRLAHFPPPPDSVQVTSAGPTPVTFAVTAKTNSGGPWLSVTTSGNMTPATLSISYNVSGLAAGVYAGQVTIATASGTTVVIPVTLAVVIDSGIVLQSTPSSLSFSYTVGGTVPPGQSIVVAVAGDPVIFQASVSAPPNEKWLLLSMGGGSTPAILTVNVDPKGLSPGAYSGLITLRLAGSSSVAQSVPVSLTIQAAPILPSISPNGVVNAANLTGAIAPGSWFSIFGANFAPAARSWRDSDFVGGKLPESLDGVSVTVNGKPAPVAYISPAQINALAPDDTATGLVPVQVKTPAGTSSVVLALEQTVAPAFFQFRSPAAYYVAGTHSDGSYLAGSALVQQGIIGTPAKPGDIIVIYGTGFGSTQPVISATALVPSPLPLASLQDLRIRVGGLDAEILYAGLISPGVYQFNLRVPEVADGDRPIVAELHGLLTKSDLMLPVQH